jgi:hypothetical protein
MPAHPRAIPRMRPCNWSCSRSSCSSSSASPSLGVCTGAPPRVQPCPQPRLPGPCTKNSSPAPCRPTSRANSRFSCTAKRSSLAGAHRGRFTPEGAKFAEGINWVKIPPHRIQHVEPRRLSLPQAALELWRPYVGLGFTGEWKFRVRGVRTGVAIRDKYNRYWVATRTSSPPPSNLSASTPRATIRPALLITKPRTGVLEGVVQNAGGGGGHLLPLREAPRGESGSRPGVGHS